MGIPSGATNQAGAMVVVNFLISPEAQFQKLQPDVWGDGTVLSLEKLPATWRDRFEHVPQRHNAALRSEIQPFALKEPAPEYMIRLYRDFRKNVLEK
jgi:putative spermidine/putrescine transport system substrate-binding protein